MSSWFHLLDSAASPGQIVYVVRDYFALWSPEEIALLPVECRPQHMRAPADVEDLHRRTLEAMRASDPPAEVLAVLGKVTAIVAAASVRLALMRATSRDPDAEPTGREKRTWQRRD